MRASYGLHPEKTTLLLSAGALGVGPTELIVERLKHLRHDAQTIVVCGRSEEVKQRVTQAAAGQAGKFCILGYSDRMHELMHISDLFIGKPGGLTTSEALACGLPVAYRQSGGHPELVGEAGLGFERPEELPDVLDRLVAELDERRAAIRVPRLEEIADRYLEVLLR